MPNPNHNTAPAILAALQAAYTTVKGISRALGPSGPGFSDDEAAEAQVLVARIALAALGLAADSIEVDPGDVIDALEGWVSAANADVAAAERRAGWSASP